MKHMIYIENSIMKISIHRFLKVIKHHTIIYILTRWIKYVYTGETLKTGKSVMMWTLCDNISLRLDGTRTYFISTFERDEDGLESGMKKVRGMKFELSFFEKWPSSISSHMYVWLPSCFLWRLHVFRRSSFCVYISGTPIVVTLRQVEPQCSWSSQV